MSGAAFFFGWLRAFPNLWGPGVVSGMFGMFKKDPAEKLRKEHARLLSEAHRLSTVDRARSDEMTAKAAEVEAKLLALQDGAA